MQTKLYSISDIRSFSIDLGWESIFLLSENVMNATYVYGISSHVHGKQCVMLNEVTDEQFEFICV